MRHYIDIVNETLLLEAQRYEDMFNPVMRVATLVDQAMAVFYSKHKQGPDYAGLDDDLKDVVSDRATGDAKRREWSEEIAAEIRWAKSELKRQDRITWYLRLVRIAMIKPYAIAKKSGLEEQDFPARELAHQLYERWQHEYRAHLDDNTASWVDDISISHIKNLKRDLPHFLSLPSHDIQTYIFDRQVISHLYTDLNGFAKAWEEETRNAIAPTDDDPIILSQTLDGDEWSWVHLQRAYCSQEAEAMGHCGNKPNEFEGETILSLRKKINRGSTFLWKPYATFILTDEGALTEMKGRFNEKPGHHGEREQVMEMVVALLRLPMVKQIKGGGYASHKNFNINDLPKDKKEALLKDRPELGNAYHYLKTKGYDGTFENMLYAEVENELGSARVLYDLNDDHAVIDQWEDVTRLANSYDVHVDSDSDINKVLDLVGGDFDSIDMDDITSLRVSIAEQDEYAEARKYIENSGTSLARFMHYHGEDIDMLRHEICKRVEKNAEGYALNWFNTLPFDAPIHFVLTEDGKVEARMDTEQLARALDLNGAEPDEWGDLDPDASILSNVRSEGWFHYDAWQAKSDTENGEGLKMPPKQLVSRLRKVAIKLMTRAIQKYLK